MQERALRGPTGGAGEIEGTEVSLSSRISARVTRLHVKKGAAVKKGDRLVSLDCADAQASLSEAQERLTAAQEQARAAEASIGAARATQQVAGSARAASEAQAASLSAQRDATLRQASRLDALTEDVPSLPAAESPGLGTAASIPTVLPSDLVAPSELVTPSALADSPRIGLDLLVVEPARPDLRPAADINLAGTNTRRTLSR
jgi:multidrug efflux pump subunit AcrA (membrane-fusion protein)